jgi:Icc-related predicted phosphoesterase
VIRVAAVGDVHLDASLRGRVRPALESIGEHADVLLLAGDLTRHGTVEEAEVVAEEYGHLAVPVVAVLGNHDYQSDAEDRVRKVLEDVDITVLEGETWTAVIDGERLGVAGAKGFGIGFSGRSASDFGEPEMKAYSRHAKACAQRLADALAQLDADRKVALMHYAPVDDTLVGERPEIWPFLGSYLLAEACDAYGVELAVHGHAHAGREKGLTAGGVRVRNVAQPVIRRPYAVYCLGSPGELTG